MAGSAVGGEVKAEPNLTPLLDIVFQLITFFMLVINFSQDTYDQRVRLPVAGSAQPIEAGKVDRDRLVLNIDSEGRLLMSGRVLGIDEALREIALQADFVRLNASAVGTKLKRGDVLPTTVVLRADRNASFAHLYRLIQACQAQGFQKFELKAMSGEA